MTEAEKSEIVEKGKALFDLLDRYLIGDLETMVNEVGQRDRGGLGYPAVHSVVAGIELMGLLVSRKTQEEAFNFFWENYFKQEKPCYEGANTMVYRTVRHGTAHIFLVKAGISVTKSGENHFELHEKDGREYLNIDAKCFFEDFKSCYEKVKKSILDDQDERMLAKFNYGYEQLLRQIEGGQAEVSRFIRLMASGNGGRGAASRPSLMGNASTSAVSPTGQIGQTTTVPPTRHGQE